jgi:hypothetical protein
MNKYIFIISIFLISCTNLKAEIKEIAKNAVTIDKSNLSDIQIKINPQYIEVYDLAKGIM